MVVEKSIDIILLFNPWCDADTCHYLGSSGDLDEYILSTVGKIWIGTADSSYGRPWQHSQFMKDTLEVALSLLDQMKENSFDPVKVSQYFSTMVNSQDGRGILMKNMSGDYSKGKSPYSWVGSAQILSHYKNTKSPVKYGQCWMASGLLTTLLRSVGIATRSVTIYGCACTSAGKDIIQYFTEDGREIPGPNSIWQFHVLNEVYFSRNDLPRGFGGWQVLDVFPQLGEPRGASLGPASQLSLKKGLALQYNVEKITGMLNSMVRAYLLHRDNTVSLADADTSMVGRKVCTKAVKGGIVHQDLTAEYKGPSCAPLQSTAELMLNLKVADDVTIGSSFPVKVTLTNVTAKPVQCRLSLTGQAATYSGDHGRALRCGTKQSWSLEAGQVKEYEMEVESKDYLWLPGGDGFLTFVAMAVVAEGVAKTSCIVKSRSIRVKTPDIVFDIPTGVLHLYKPAVVKVKFVNSLGRRLTNGIFRLFGGGHVINTEQSIGPVSPWGTAEAILETVPLKKGQFQAVVGFTSDQLVDLIGDMQLEVLE